MKTVILYCLTFAFVGVCTVGQAHENYSPDIFVAVKESDNFFDNNADGYINTLSLPPTNFVRFNDDQFWNKLFASLNKRMNELDNLFSKVDKASIHNSSSISFLEKFIYPTKMDNKVKKSILKRIPRNAESSSVNTIVTTVTPSSVHSDSTVLNTTISKTIEPQTTPNSTVTTVSNNTTSNLTDTKTVSNSNITIQSTDATITTSTSLNTSENTTVKQEEKPVIPSNDIITLKTTSCDTPSNHVICDSCSLKMVFLFLGLLMGIGISIIIYIRQKGRGSRTFYHVRNICRKHEDSPV